jgi:TRAP-type C4-dicarboxylate transport system substrate-binding protein
MTLRRMGRRISRRQFVQGACAVGTAVALDQFPSRALAQASPHVIRALSSWEKPLIWNKPFFDLADRVNSKSGGRLRIDWVGGPEAVPLFQGADAVGKGLFDLLITAPAFVAPSVPEATALYLREDLSLRDLHSSGIVKSLDSICREKIGATLIGMPAGGQGVGFTFFTRLPPKDLEFFRGRRIRTTPLFTPLLKALGSSTVTVTPAEVYPALERGVVDGVGWPLIGIVERKFHEVAKYMLMPAFYAVRSVLLMNARAFERIPAALRKVLLESISETEDYAYKLFKDESEREIDQIRKEGVVVVNLPLAEGRKYVQLANDAMWEQVIKDSPKNGPRLKDLFLKAKH